MDYSEDIECIYRMNLDSYPLLETELTPWDAWIWNHKLAPDYSCIGNLVLETRDSELMDRLIEKRYTR